MKKKLLLILPLVFMLTSCSVSEIGESISTFFSSLNETKLKEKEVISTSSMSTQYDYDTFISKLSEKCDTFSSSYNETFYSSIEDPKSFSYSYSGKKYIKTSSSMGISSEYIITEENDKRSDSLSFDYSQKNGKYKRTDTTELTNYNETDTTKIKTDFSYYITGSGSSTTIRKSDNLVRSGTSIEEIMEGNRDDLYNYLLEKYTSSYFKVNFSEESLISEFNSSDTIKNYYINSDETVFTFFRSEYSYQITFGNNKITSAYEYSPSKEFINYKAKSTISFTNKKAVFEGYTLNKTISEDKEYITTITSNKATLKF